MGNGRKFNGSRVFALQDLQSSASWIPQTSLTTSCCHGTGLALCRDVTERHDRLDALEARTQRFSVKVLRLLDDQTWSPVILKVVQQLASSATSVAANHRAVRRARSTREFAAKLQVVNEEIDETVHWLETLQATGACRVPEQLLEVLKEGRELRAIFAKARKTTRALL